MAEHVAWQVNGDEYSLIVFARNYGEARREAASQDPFMGDIEEIESCYRVPGLNKYYPGPVPLKLLMLERHWWSECFCGRRIEGEAVEKNEEKAIFWGDLVYCGYRCLFWHWKIIIRIKWNRIRRRKNHDY
jgi:hypothetical protein